MTPLRAKYGAKGNRHDLLEWQGHPTPLPSELLGLTDMPCGTFAPGVCWWPSVGCEPLGDWWALWWTVPDSDAPRGGMVKSEVALWPFAEIGHVADLRPVMASLAGLDTISPTPTDLLSAVAEALVTSETGKPPIVVGLEAWPSIIADLWLRLWPEARQTFSARVALSPPQGGESVAPPWLFGIPSTRSSEWSRHRLITVGSASKTSNRAAAWLMGNDDPTFETIKTACHFRAADLKSLGKIARAADHLDKMQNARQPQQALDFLRTLVILAPDINTAEALKAEALQIVSDGLANGSATWVMSLANLGPALPEAHLPTSSLSLWTSQNAPILSTTESAKLLEKLSPSRAESWWQRAMQNSLSEGLANPDYRWEKAALYWLSLEGCAEVLKEILPATEKLETALLTTTSDTTLSTLELQQIRTQTIERHWSRLHAWTATKLFSANDAFQKQRTFSGNPLPGLAYLVEHLSGLAVIQETITNPDNQLISLVAQRTAKEPQLLQDLDVSHSAWCKLWAAHVNTGGTLWPANANREILGNGLLDAVLTGDESPVLIAKLAEDLAELAFCHPRRAELWSKLSNAGCKALLPYVADILIGQCNAGQTVTMLEPQLVAAVVIQARKTRPSVKVLAVLLFWNVQLNEQEVVTWLSSYARMDWDTTAATTVANAALSRRWKQVAEKLYHLYRYNNLTNLKPAIVICQNLLSFLPRLWLTFDAPSQSQSAKNMQMLILGVAELGADLAPYDLVSIWERAGGKQKQLKIEGSPAQQWQEAAKLAYQGGLQEGLLGLVKELKEKLPNNPQLHEIEKIITASQSIRK
ncbi:MAG: hypothetical protein PHR16_14810 [Methylovulum sp.]|nr:hypothetical protein [Methylovulum sp.]